MKNENNRQLTLYRCLSSLLDYPTLEIAEQTRECIDILKTAYPQSVEQMTRFLSFLEETPSGRLEEIYTATFDINPACHIFAGHILFGESFKRGAFMAGLTDEYQNHAFDTSKELADHIPLLLKFIGTLEQDDALTKELLSDCLIPVFQKMNANFKEDSSNPYVAVLRTASVVLEGAE
ncbi:MAG TPA: nitrate reductase molybdenum cofactor assembly chaperone [Gammaproteobacteria bacterium]|nr:nitrate reductase molybdenum cofactor assembly chaperone [Candidatus Parabeggiatoa sp.]HAI69059.1 nitrate reductase molybdenum cofactor assembly chaperone [Gammaproteobacteria bacterium]